MTIIITWADEAEELVSGLRLCWQVCLAAVVVDLPEADSAAADLAAVEVEAAASEVSEVVASEAVEPAVAGKNVGSLMTDDQ